MKQIQGGESNMKETKKHLWLSAVSLMLCMVLLVGTTFAWFTDSVVSKDNVIQAGRLSVELWGNGTQITDQSEPVFNYDKWEPGYSTGAELQVRNTGTLAVEFELEFQRVVATQGLEHVIDVYAGEQKLGTLASFMNGEDLDTGILEAGENSVGVTYTLKMREDAGNDYQNAEATFDIVLRAKQATVETDGFGSSDYDKDAEYDGEVSTEASLIAAAKNGGNYKLTCDIALEEVLTVDAGTELVLNLGGNEITSTDTYPISNKGNLTLVDGRISSDSTTEKPKPALYSESGNLTVKDCVFESTSAGATHLGNYSVQVRGGTAVFDHCTIIGKRGGFDVGNDARVTVKGGTYSAGAYYPVYTWGNAEFNATDAVFKKDVSLGATIDSFYLVYASENSKLGFDRCEFHTPTYWGIVTGNKGAVTLNDCHAFKNGVEQEIK